MGNLEFTYLNSFNPNLKLVDFGSNIEMVLLVQFGFFLLFVTFFFLSEFMYAHLFMYGCFCGGILLFEDIFRCSAMSAFWNCSKWHFAAKDFGFLFIWAPYKSCVLNLFHFSLNVLFRD